MSTQFPHQRSTRAGKQHLERRGKQRSGLQLSQVTPQTNACQSDTGNAQHHIPECAQPSVPPCELATTKTNEPTATSEGATVNEPVTMNRIEWKADLLGPGFEMTEVELHPDFEGRRITTIVRHTPTADPNRHKFAQQSIAKANTCTVGLNNPFLPQPTTKPRFAFLAIHGWNDYFYQVELARAISALGGSFYALDLSKYGRSHLPHQMWGYTSDLSYYDDDIHAARDIIYSELPDCTPFFLYGHSTGGLTGALWADRHPGALDGLVLNSPWLEIQAATIIRHASHPAIEAIARLDPQTIIPSNDDGFYQRTLTGDHFRDHLDDPLLATEPNPELDPFFNEGWQPDPRFRHFPSFPVRAGWLNAILSGHERVAAGLNITSPVLTLTSARSLSGAHVWSAEHLATDSVLRVDQIWKRCLNLTNSLTLEKIPNAIHDVILSRHTARARAFSTIAHWINTILPTA